MAIAYGGKHRPMGIILLGTDYTTDLTSVPVDYLLKAASSICASRTPAFCNCSRMIGVFATT
jgi:hypothetical protein